MSTVVCSKRWCNCAPNSNSCAATTTRRARLPIPPKACSRPAQERLAQQLRQLESDKQALQADLGFFERLLPTSGEGLQLRGLQAEVVAPGQIKYQILVVQNGKGGPDFHGRYEMQLTGQLDGKAWTQPLPGGARALQIKQVARVEGTIDHPAAAVIKTVQVRVLDAQGVTRATQTARL